MFVKSVHLHQPSCTSLVVLPLKHNIGGGQGGRGAGGQEPGSNGGGKSTGGRRRESRRWNTQGGRRVVNLKAGINQ